MSVKRNRVDPDADEPIWTALDWRIFYEQIQHLRAFWDARLKLSYKERETIPKGDDPLGGSHL